MISAQLTDALAARAAADRPVRVGVIGAGSMGRGIALQIAAFTRGMRLVGIANRTLARGLEAARFAGGRAAVVESPGATARSIEAAAVAVTQDPQLVTRSPHVDVVVEATGSLDYAAGVVADAIEHGKHVVLMNAELDATVGLALDRRAEAAGVVYTNADGDQPGAIMNLYRFARQIGLRPVLCGNIKGMLDRHRTPATQAAFAAHWQQTAAMVTSFADGTKLAFEQAVVANATNSRLLAPGMLGPAVEPGTPIDAAAGLFPTDALLAGGCVVDYVIGAHPAPGVFVLAACDHPAQRGYLEYYKLGAGPLYCLHTPFHLCHFEVPITIAQAALSRTATVRPVARSAEVIAFAKRSLPAGAKLDGIGGYDCFGGIEEVQRADSAGLLPMGLIEGATLRRPVAAGAPLRMDDVDLPAPRLLDTLRREQITLST